MRPRLRPAALLRLRVRLGRADSGRAILEFVVVGVLLLVPMVYLVLVVGRLQAASYAVSAAAREGGRAFVTAPQEMQAPGRAQVAASIPLGDFGFEGQGATTYRCDGSPCLRPEGRIAVTETVQVALPWVPDFLAGSLPTSVPVSATHVVTAERFAGR
ncbi:pilus assembly protein [Lapillicoccus jejuensis]|uniref:TadE-like protein n=1 Tax=Lapillicoccus jejuensis TaxID=402171 RepID=A0A542DWB5_9MICO|nr:pilus assembly protein [Lapillicoccus jejuensis]TQJ07204.1 hypothetical protein FB458_0258 [Lapillicoccus jejuensis]